MRALYRRRRPRFSPLLQPLDPRRLLSTSILSVDTTGTGAGGSADLTLSPATSLNFSPDGRYLLFTSAAANLITGVTDTNNVADVFLRDLTAGTTTILSVSSTGVALGANAFLYTPTFSPDSRYLVFRSSANNLVSGVIDTNGTTDLFVRDLTADTTSVVSINSFNSATGNGGTSGFSSDRPAFTSDSRYILFTSLATNLGGPPGDNGTADIFLRDLATGSTTLISGDTTGQPHAAGTGAIDPVLSPNNRYIVFSSTAGNLATGVTDSNLIADLYIRDRQTNTTRLVSRDATNTARGFSGTYQFTPDGLLIFSSPAPLTADADTNLGEDLYAYDPATDTLTLLSARTTGGAGDQPATLLGLSPNGRYLAFSSPSSNLTPQSDDSDDRGDLYIRDLQSNTTRFIAANTSLEPVFPNIRFTPDSASLLFTSAAPDLTTTPDTNAKDDLFLFNLATNQTSLLTVNAAGTAAAGLVSSIDPAFVTVSPDSRYISFLARASDLVEGFSSVNRELFVRDLAEGVTRAVTVTDQGTGAGFDPVSTILPVFSADSRFLLFITQGVVAGTGEDTNLNFDLFAFDVVLGQSTLLSATPSGAAGDGGVLPGSLRLSPTGDGVAFISSASNYIAGVTDTPLTTDLFFATLPDPANPAFPPEISVSGNGIDIADGAPASPAAGTAFGSTTVGDPIERTFTVTNTGTGPLIISNFAIPAGFEVVEPLAKTIAAGASDTFTIRFSATTDGSFSGNLSFNTNDADESPFTFAISASASPFIPAGPGPAVFGNTVRILPGDPTPSPTDHTDFGSTPVGTPLQRTFTLMNAGSTNLIVSGLSVPAGFTILEGLPDTLLPGASDTFTIEFPASQLGSFTGNVSFLTNAPALGTFAFSIRAEAIDPTAPPPPPPPPTNPAGPDLAFAGSVTSVKLGSFIAGAKGGKAAAKLINHGPAIFAGNLSVGFYISSDTLFSEGDTLQTTVTKKATLKPGKSANLSAKFNYPTGLPDGAYYILAVADPGNGTVEVSESNNVTTTANTITIAAPQVDLAGSSLAPKGRFTIGRKASAVLMLTAAGNIPATGPITIQLFASPDGTLASAVPLGSALIKLKQKPGTTKKVTLPANLSTLSPGNFTLIAQIDTANALAETNEGNNTTFSAVPIAVQ